MLLQARRNLFSGATSPFKPRRAKISSPKTRSYYSAPSSSSSSMAPVTGAIYPTWHDRDLERAREVDLFSRLLKDRIIYLCGAINEHTAATVVAQLLLLNSEDSKAPIQMYIDSPGGHVSAGMAIYDTMQFIRAPVVTTCLGQACSMASLLLAAGAPGMRRALPHSFVMIHQPSSGTQGQASDMERATKQVLRVKAMLNDIYVKHTGQPVEKIEKDLDRDTWLSAEEALEWRIIDKIVTKMEEKPASAASSTSSNASNSSSSTSTSSSSTSGAQNEGTNPTPAPQSGTSSLFHGIPSL